MQKWTAKMKSMQKIKQGAPGMQKSQPLKKSIVKLPQKSTVN